MASGEWRARGRPFLAGLVLGLALTGCSDDDAPGARTPAGASATATVTAALPATPTAEATPSVPTPTVTPAPATPPATNTPTAPHVTDPTATPTASPTPVQPQKHANGTFTIVVSQGAVRQAVHVEVAATLAQRQQGLMFRTQLGEDEGMLFLFEREVQTGFWMRNTRVPLDIAYIGTDLRVNEIKPGTPFDETPLVPAAPYRYVLEVNQGWFARNGLGPGATIELPDGLPTATAN